MKRSIIEINESLCNGCGQCVTGCAEGALKIVNGKAKLISDQYCDGLGACLGTCPTGALKIVEREAAEFDESKVSSVKQEKKTTLPCGCPGSMVKKLNVQSDHERMDQHVAVSTWPIQLALVPATADFLKGADLLIAADCTAFANTTIYQNLLKGRVLLIACPKLDNIKPYRAKLTEIFKTAHINSITVLRMSVPCCQSFTQLVKESLQDAEENVKCTEVILPIG